MLDDIPEDTKGESYTPAAHHLFDICRRYNQSVLDRHIYFSPFCSTTTTSFKEGTPRHPSMIILPVK